MKLIIPYDFKNKKLGGYLVVLKYFQGIIKNCKPTK
jgi:hypothetical protein